MKTLGIQLKASEAILVVLERDARGQVSQLKQSAKYRIDDQLNCEQVRQFRDQINVAFDSIKPDRIAVLARNASGRGPMAVSPSSFKLEGIIQLYEKKRIEFIWPQTVKAHIKKNAVGVTPFHQYQQDALELAAYLLN